MKRLFFTVLVLLFLNTTYAQVKATSGEINTGTDDDKFATALALQGSKYLDQNGAKISAVTAAGANTYVASITPAITAYISGQVFYLKITTANTGASTLNLNGLGAKTLVKDASSPLDAGDLLANKVYAVYYDGTNFQVMNIGGVAYVLKSGDIMSGDLGITKSLPKLSLNGSDIIGSIGRISYSIGGAERAFINANRHFAVGQLTNLEFGTMGNTHMTLSNIGYLGLGVASPLVKLDVLGTARLTNAGSALQLYSTTGTGNTYMSYHNNVGTRLGYVGLGSSINNNMYIASDLGSVNYIGSSHVFNSPIIGRQSGTGDFPVLGDLPTGALTLANTSTGLYGIQMGVRNSDGITWLQSGYFNGATVTPSFILNPKGGWVGVGSVNGVAPLVPFHVKGQIRSERTNTGQFIQMDSENGSGNFLAKNTTSAVYSAIRFIQGNSTTDRDALVIGNDGTVTASTFIGNLTGNASTATLATNSIQWNGVVGRISEALQGSGMASILGRHSNGDVYQFNSLGLSTFMGLGNYVLKSGETMTGPLAISSAIGAKFTMKKTASNQNNYINFLDEGSSRTGYIGHGSTTSTSMYIVSDLPGTTVNLGVAGTNQFSVATTGITTTVPVVTSAGSAAAPSHSFSGDTGTGMWNNPGILGFTVSGTHRVGISSTLLSSTLPINSKGPTKIERTNTTQYVQLDHENGEGNLLAKNTTSAVFSSFRIKQGNNVTNRDALVIGNDGTVTASTFIGNLTGTASSVPWAGVASKPTTLVGYGITDAALDANVVHKTGNETIAGVKLFSTSVGIGTTNVHTYKLAVGGGIIAESVKVKPQVSWPDYVFEKDYPILPLNELEKFVLKNKHLPNVPNAAEVKKDGIDVGEMNAKLLQKIEELTLYIIDQQKGMMDQQKEIRDLRGKVNEMTKLSELVEKLSAEVNSIKNK
ncbi:hypothetical protein [Pedobacter nyackensis]|uniref:hypothetical protein n=1 Tax=Pedobacter nyackensis TaxID=475255 RepID=UPI00292E00E1|nr:hypothetical protein [Pedobacter nyackensis]